MRAGPEPAACRGEDGEVVVDGKSYDSDVSDSVAD